MVSDLHPGGFQHDDCSVKLWRVMQNIKLFNSCRSVDEYTPIRRFSAKPLSKPMLCYCQLDHWEQNLSEILIKMQNVSFTKMHLKISSAKWWPFSPWGRLVKSGTMCFPHDCRAFWDMCSTGLFFSGKSLWDTPEHRQNTDCLQE